MASQAWTQFFQQQISRWEQYSSEVPPRVFSYMNISDLDSQFETEAEL